MKKTVLPAACLLLFLCGCASSERMARLSGGVVQEYSAPRKHRIRSQKFQKKTGSFSRQESARRSGFAEKSLINIWPFFFRSDDYYAALWPFFDYDPYGFAVRPLFNKEGDDYSILFPLSAWNTSSQGGWVTLFYWEKELMGLFPLLHQSFNKKRGACYYTPLFIRTWKDNSTPTWASPCTQDDFYSFLLGYYRKKIQKDTSSVPYLYSYARNRYEKYQKELMAYKLYGSATPVPRNAKEYNAYRQKVFAALPLTEELYYGFVPLFFRWSDREETGFNIAGILLHCSKWKNSSTLSSLCHLLYSYSFTRYAPLWYLESREKTVIAPLLTYWGETHYKKETPKRKDIKALERLGARTDEPFAKNLPEIKRLYKKLTGREMPPVICTYPLVRQFVQDFAKKQVWETEKESCGGFLPLYCFFAGRNKFFWTSPLLLTFCENRKNSSYFLSLPLFTLWKSSSGSSLRSTAGPLVYYSKKRKTSPLTRPVFDRKTFFVKEHQQHIFEDTYALCGLYYRGRDGFSVVKKGWDARKIEALRREAFELKRRHENLVRHEKTIAARKKRNSGWQVKSRLDELKKMVDTEEIRLEQKKAADDAALLKNKIRKWNRNALKTGVQFTRSSLEKKSFDAALERFLKKTTDLRFSEDFGSGLFFRKELAENGDHKWHIFAYLASGSKEGTKEKTQILHFLYRHTRRGDRVEKIIFPFITVRKNKNFSSCSFLWRLWETHETPRGKGGYIFFIPWGK